MLTLFKILIISSDFNILTLNAIFGKRISTFERPHLAFGSIIEHRGGFSLLQDN